MPSEQDEFLAAIQQNWTDLELRAIYADWLEEQGKEEDVAYQRGYGKVMEDARQWIADFSKDYVGGPEHYDEINHEPVSVDELLETALTWVSEDGEEAWGEHIRMGTNERYAEIPESIMEEFWHKVYLLTGKKAKNSPRFFSCAC